MGRCDMLDAASAVGAVHKLLAELVDELNMKTLVLLGEVVEDAVDQDAWREDAAFTPAEMREWLDEARREVWYRMRMNEWGGEE